MNWSTADLSRPHWSLGAPAVFFLTLLGPWFFIPNADAGSLTTPRRYISASVLPKGTTSVRYLGFATTVSNQYDDGSNSIPVGEPLNNPLTINDIINSKSSAADQAAIRGYLNAKGWTDHDAEIGDTSGVINATANANIPIFAFGVTRKLTMALIVPVVSTDVDYDTGFVKNQLLEDINGELVNDRPDDAEDLARLINNAIQEELASNGYKPLEDEKKTSLGDIKVKGKLNLSRKKYYSHTLVTTLTLPTGETADVNKLVDLAPGDGQMDIGLGLNTDWRLGKRVKLFHGINYTAQLPDSTAKRIPREAGESITPDVDPNVDRDLGDIVTAQAGSIYNFWEGAHVSGAYNFQYKFKDSYSGQAFEGERYSYLEDETEQRMHSAQIGIGYSTIGHYRKKEFSVPLEARLMHTQTFAGKNATNDPLTSLELRVYF